MDSCRFGKSRPIGFLTSAAAIMITPAAGRCSCSCKWSSSSCGSGIRSSARVSGSVSVSVSVGVSVSGSVSVSEMLVMFPVAVVQRRRRFVRLLFKLVLHDVGAVEGRSRKSTSSAWRNM